MPRITMLVATLIALLTFGTPAAAAVINLSIVGDFDGSFDGRSFNGRTLTFTGTSESSTPDEVFDEYQYRLTSLSVTLDGKYHQVTEAAMFFIAPLSHLAGIVDPDATKGLVRFDYSIGNRFYTDAQTQPFSTSGGLLMLGAGTNIALSGVSIAAVPEPGTWAMMIVGLALVGVATRNRKRSLRARDRSRQAAQRSESFTSLTLPGVSISA
ncbi:MAG: PEPxxWA-CTERM sorting domain-containing protein [Sphingomonas phyllosphaerae]